MALPTLFSDRKNTPSSQRRLLRGKSKSKVVYACQADV